MKLNDKVREHLKNRNWSQNQLAQASGIEPSVLSRLLTGERSWRMEHIACVAAALSTTPEALTQDTEVESGSTDLDIEFITTLTKSHGTLMSENTRLSEDIAGLREKLKLGEAEQQRLASLVSDLEIKLDRETRSKEVMAQDKRNAERREVERAREARLLSSQVANLESENQVLKDQIRKISAEHAKTIQIANQNYAAVQELKKTISTATGVAVAAGVVGLVALVAKSR